jgi:hypothetical protein
MCCDLFVVRLLRWFFCLLGHGSFHFVLCFPPFLGALIIYDWQGFIIFDLLPIALERERERFRSSTDLVSSSRVGCYN